METLYDLFKSSAVVQALIALGTIATLCYLFVTTGDAPKELITIAALILGYYFGTKTQQAIGK